MFWFSRPPYLRWLAAGTILAAAFAVELWPEATVAHPFAVESVVAGQPITAVEWRPVPVDTLPSVAGLVMVAAHDIAAGEPLLPSSLGSAGTLPAGWWAVAVPVPAAAGVGDAVMLVVDGQAVQGIVVTPAADDPLAFEPEALVGVPGDAATAVADAVRGGDLVVLVQP